MKRMSMLSDRAADEPALIAMAQHGDKAAMGTLLARFQPMLWLLSRRLSSTAAIPWEELVQAGNLGLMQAVRRYDEQQNVRLITYAVPWILGEMRRTLRSMQFRCLSLEEERGEESRTLMECMQGAGGVDLERVDLRLAMQRLPQDAQTLICLRYFRDHTQAETAQLLHKSQTQISRMERRALDQLHAILTE
ncbi:MAG: sigma-70 family RNA polymerase sigma factor [Candidatus Ventricola sp.]|nr:sigma-70 family RNA polymerase sigma factor [Candidatus Ventricola sp.]